MAETLDLRRAVMRCAECGQRFGADGVFCPFDGAKLEATAWDPAGDPLLRRIIDGRYEVVGVLGEGGMGTVYQVRHTTLDRPFAMKVLRRDLANDPDLAARFLREARATASVKHPNIVAITDFGRLDESVPYFVMEHLVGQTLAHSIKAGGSIPAGLGVRIALKVAAAPRGGPRREDRSPRYQAGQRLRPRLGGEPGDGRCPRGRLRRRADHRREPRHQDRGRLRHPSLHEPRAGERTAGRSPRGHLCARRHPVRDVHWARPLRRRHVHGRPHAAHVREARPAEPREGPRAARGLGALEDIILRALEKKPEHRYATMQDLAADITRVSSFGPDGSLRLAPSSEEAVASSRPVFAMANALEPATREEASASVLASGAGARRGRARAWLTYGAIALGVATVTIALNRLLHRPRAQAVVPPLVETHATTPLPPTVGGAPSPASSPSSTPDPSPPPVPTAASARSASRAPRSAPSSPKRPPAPMPGDFTDPWAK